MGKRGNSACPASPRRAAALAMGSILVLAAAAAAPPARLEIVPGPTAMSEEEKAIAPGPSPGSEHGVVLIEETLLEDDLAHYTKITYHMRAKILSNEARDLGNIVIPFNSKTGYFKKWWGRTLLPDGTVLDLKQDDLSPQTVIRGRGVEVRVLKGALPGVAPGCVVDYGYSVWRKEFESTIRVPLQRRWPVRHFRYRWAPWGGMARWYHISRGDKLALKVERDNDGILVTADNVPPVVDEPWAPPDDQTRAIATFYYSTLADNRTDYWDYLAEGWEYAIKAFNKDQRPVREALASMGIPAGAALDTKLRAVYDWMSRNLTNTSLRSSEQIEADTDERKKQRLTARNILAQREGGSFELDYLFIGFARLLGAEANLVLVVDRTERYWDPGLLSARQFDSAVVAVRPPGAPEDKATLVDPGSGLPYGEVPWWNAGTKGLVAKEKTSSEITVWPSEARQNISESKVEIDLAAGNGSVPVRWSRSSRGQHGLGEKRHLRTLDPTARAERLDEVCGSKGELEISSARTEGLEDPNAGLNLSCEGALMEAPPDDTSSEYRLQFRGPWIEPYPELTALTRVHPVVLEFRRMDLTRIDVTAPTGFVPAAAPPLVKLEGQLGTYTLAISTTAKGYHIERALSILHLAVTPEGYEALRSFLSKVREADATYLYFKRAARSS